MPALGTAYIVIRASLGPLKAGLAAAHRTVRAALKGVYATFGSFLKFTARWAKRLAALTVAGLTASIYAFSRFQQQMRNVSTMLDRQTMHYLPEYDKAIRRMAVEFGESAQTLTRGLYDILSASIAPAKALDVLAVAVKAARAGLSDTAVAADALTTILNAYDMSAEAAGRISDVLFAIIKRGKTTFGELAPVIGRVAAIAAQAGLSFEEVGATLATMTRAGLKTDIAITSLRGIITSFLKPTEEAKAAASELGVELNAATLRGLGLVGVLNKLRGASAEQLARLIPNVRALAGFAASLQKAAGQAADLQLMMHSTGLTEEAFAKMTDSLAFRLARLKQAFVMLGVAVGEALSPAVARIIAAVQARLSGLTKAVEKHSRTISMWAEKIAVRIQYYIKVVIAALRADWKETLHYACELALSSAEALGKGLVIIFKKVIDDILSYARPAFRKFIDTQVAKLAEPFRGGLYRKLTGVPRFILYGLVPELGREAEARARARVREWERLGFYEPTPSKTWAQVYKELRSIKVRRPELSAAIADSIKAPMQQMFEELKTIDEKYKKAETKAVIDSAGAVKDTAKHAIDSISAINAAAQGKIGFIGLREAWKAVAERLYLPAKADTVKVAGLGELTQASKQTAASSRNIYEQLLQANQNIKDLKVLGTVGP